MTRDWRALVRAHVPPLELEREPEILDELSQHLADLYDEAIADGRPPDEAFAIAKAALPDERERLARDLVTARRSLPGLIADRWTENDPGSRFTKNEKRLPGSFLFADLRRDAIYAVKALRRAPGYTIVTLLTLALGIGANSAIFAAVDTILLRPMPYAHADRLVVPLSIHTARDIESNSVSFADYADWRRETTVFDAVTLWRPLTVDLTGVGQPERIRAIQVSPDYFRVMTDDPGRRAHVDAGGSPAERGARDGDHLRALAAAVRRRGGCHRPDDSHRRHPSRDRRRSSRPRRLA